MVAKVDSDQCSLRSMAGGPVRLLLDELDAIKAAKLAKVLSTHD